VANTIFRAVVVWLLLLVTWGVFRALTALGDEFIVVRLVRDIAGASLWLLPGIAAVGLIGDRLFDQESRPPDNP
jgi:hypothetical protein